MLSALGNGRKFWALATFWKDAILTVPIPLGFVDNGVYTWTVCIVSDCRHVSYMET